MQFIYNFNQQLPGLKTKGVSSKLSEKVKAETDK